MNETKIYLVSKATENADYSIEAGKHDGVKHFDHHGEYSKNAPVMIQDIPRMTGRIEITHFDADVFVSLQRGLGKNVEFSDGELNILALIDAKGTSTVSKTDRAYLFVLGLDAKIKQDKKITKASKEPQDVTSKVMDLLAIPISEYVEIGRESSQKYESCYKKCLAFKRLNTKDFLARKIGLWFVMKEDLFDPSMVYSDKGVSDEYGYDVVVVWREEYESILLYGNNDTCKFKDLRGTHAEVEFEGRKFACGSSPRDAKFTKEDALEVFREIANERRE